MNLFLIRLEKDEEFRFLSGSAIVAAETEEEALSLAAKGLIIPTYDSYEIDVLPFEIKDPPDDDVYPFARDVVHAPYSSLRLLL